MLTDEIYQGTRSTKGVAQLETKGSPVNIIVAQLLQ